jgi:GMP synthase-like glutamine amidotransferase
MKIHYLQHVSFEGLGCIANWASENNHTVSLTRMYNYEDFPSRDSYDMLIVLGGPMSVNDAETVQWINTEKAFIKEAIDLGKCILGICLGAQMIANVLGAKVYANAEQEIGWHNIDIFNNTFLQTTSLQVMHWHGETFDFPNGAIHLAESEACKNQAFICRQNIIGLQFHLELRKEDIEQMITFANEELAPSAYVQTANMIRNNYNYIQQSNEALFAILHYLESKIHVDI